MPKQLYKITQFHGGLNNNSDARDIADSELADAENIMVDELGKTRMLGSAIAHSEIPANITQLHSGNGLFQFSHDRRHAQLGEHLNNTGDFSSNWTATGDFAVDATDATYTHSSGTGTLTQTAANRKNEGIANAHYKFKYTISGFSGSIGTFKILSGTGQFLRYDYTANLVEANGTYVEEFRCGNTATSGPMAPFTIEVITSGAGTFSIDDVSLTMMQASEEGDDYLAMADPDGEATIDIYSRVDDEWGTTIIHLGGGNDFQAVYYAVDGSLRVTDAGFNSSNKTKWYGYIERSQFGNGSSGVDNLLSAYNGYNFDSWHVSNQALTSVGVNSLTGLTAGGTSSTVDPDISEPISIKLEGGTTSATDRWINGAGTGNPLWSPQHTLTAIYAKFDASSGGHDYFSTHTSDGTAQSQSIDGFVSVGDYLRIGSSDMAANNKIVECDALGFDTPNKVYISGSFQHSDSVLDIDTFVQDTGISGASDGTYTNVTTTKTEGAGNDALRVTVIIASGILSVSAVSSGYEGEGYAVNNTITLTGLSAAGASGANNNGTFDVSAIQSNPDEIYISNLTRMGQNTGWWDPVLDHVQIGVSTLYDNSKQETALATRRPLLPIDSILGTNSKLDLDNIRVTFKTWTTSSNDFGLANPRVSGFKVYIRKATSSDGSGDWYLMSDIDISEGGKLVEESEDYDMWETSLKDSDTESDVLAECSSSAVGNFLRFPSVGTYSSETGAISDEEINVDAFKTAVIANRMAYIGNVKQDGKSYGDRVLKSNVNQFDRFPESRVIEASVNDGDAIVKLESYADRLLIFKKTKLELVNISQEIEFLEDIFMHKGVVHRCSTCKTDFGIAWANRQGVYLYDGQKVNNLLEKQGKQMIKESIWEDFLTSADGTIELIPLVGYLPKKRQLIVVDDKFINGDGSIYLYDMVTQSWIRGGAGTIHGGGTEGKTNFVVDWNGDLIYAHDYESEDADGIIVKWNDTSADQSSFTMATQDIDFGQPAQKKRIYKVYVTYTGAASLSVNVDYQINGDGGWTGFTAGEPLEAVSGQNEATLTFASPVECYSFQLKFSGTGKSAFVINDVSIVFRIKGVK